MNIKNSKDSTKSMALKIKKFLLCSGMVLGCGLLAGCKSDASVIQENIKEKEDLRKSQTVDK